MGQGQPIRRTNFEWGETGAADSPSPAHGGALLGDARSCSSVSGYISDDPTEHRTMPTACWKSLPGPGPARTRSASRSRAMQYAGPASLRGSAARLPGRLASRGLSGRREFRRPLREEVIPRSSRRQPADLAADEAAAEEHGPDRAGVRIGRFGQPRPGDPDREMANPFPGRRGTLRTARRRPRRNRLHGDPPVVQSHAGAGSAAEELSTVRSLDGPDDQIETAGRGTPRTERADVGTTGPARDCRT